MDYFTINIGDIIKHKGEQWRVIGKGQEHCIVEKDGVLDKIVCAEHLTTMLDELMAGFNNTNKGE